MSALPQVYLLLRASQRQQEVLGAYWSLSAAKLRAQREDYIHRGRRWRGIGAGRWRHIELPLEIWRMPIYGRFMEPMLTDGDIIQVNEAFRHQLLAREAESAAALLLAYRTVWTALADRRDAVLAAIERAQARGETVAPSLVIASRETRQLLLQVAGEIDSLAPALTDHVTTEQAARPRICACSAVSLTPTRTNRATGGYRGPRMIWVMPS